MSQATTAAGVKSIVKSEPRTIAIAQNPTTKMAIAAQNGPVILVGHSDLKVAALVCVAVFAPDKGESVAARIAYVSQPKAVASIIEAVWRMSND